MVPDFELERSVADVQRPGDRDSHRIHTRTADGLVKRDGGVIAMDVLGVMAVVLRGMRLGGGLNRCRDSPENHE
jgi:hypothetical protein